MSFRRTQQTRGVDKICFNFRTNGTSAPDRIRDGGLNQVESVTRAAAGRYTVKLRQPYPLQVIDLCAELHEAQGYVTRLRKARIVRDSYDKAAGTFTVEVVGLADTAGATNAAVEDPASGDVICIRGEFLMLSTRVQS